jgi:SAM-dependent methyltransferase
MVGQPTEPPAYAAEVTYWESWHAAYTDPSSSLSRRLAVVQDHVDHWLDGTGPRPVRVVSLCAGDGRDLLEVLASRDDADRVTATLVELDRGLAGRARQGARRWPSIEVRTADAGDASVYADLPPADLALVCGVFGNVSDEDLARTVAALPALLAPEGRVIWTRTRRAPDLTPTVRKWFANHGFREVDFAPIPDSLATVGVADLVAEPSAALPVGRLFTFEADSPNHRTLDVYEHRAERYEATQGPPPAWHLAFLDRIAASFRLGATVLELGSGTGQAAQYLADRGLVVQPSDGAVAFVERMLEAQLSPIRLDVLSDDLGGPWDAVVAFAVLLHLTPEELGTVLDRVREAVRPDGLLAFSVKEGDGSAWSDHRLGSPRFFTFWRPEPLAQVLEDHGWTVQALERRAGDRDDWILVTARRRDDRGG